MNEDEDTRPAVLLQGLSEIADRVEEEAIGGRVLRALLRDTLWEVKVLRAELATMVERVGKLEQCGVVLEAGDLRDELANLYRKATSLGVFDPAVA